MKNRTLYKPYEEFMKDNDPKGFRQFFLDLCKARQLGYLGLQIRMEAEKGKPGEKKKKFSPDPNALLLTQEELYYILVALGTMRQMLAHGNPKQNIYQIEGFGKNAAVTRVLDRLYSERIAELNNGFLCKARKNLPLLFEAFGVTDKEEKKTYVCEYYDFTVRKQYKNMGFSIKTLREQMTSKVEEAAVLRSTDYDSVRGKLYPFVDFAIYRYYQENASEGEELVGSLRASMNDVDKDAIYEKEALRIWPKLRSLILVHILPEMNGTKIN